jgi:heme/copper-type cytochrome/quinol oxidase subunit 3
MGIDGVNPFELPLLNTIILLSSGVTVTYAHHSLIQGNRKGALYGTIATIVLAVIFTGFQGLEYTVSSFTITDSVYGSCFYFGTGFHGLITSVALYICIYIIIFKTKTINNLKMNKINFYNKLLITAPSYRNKESYSFYLNNLFLE